MVVCGCLIVGFREKIDELVDKSLHTNPPSSLSHSLPDKVLSFPLGSALQQYYPKLLDRFPLGLASAQGLLKIDKIRSSIKKTYSFEKF